MFMCDDRLRLKRVLRNRSTGHKALKKRKTYQTMHGGSSLYRSGNGNSQRFLQCESRIYVKKYTLKKNVHCHTKTRIVNVLNLENEDV